MLMIYKKQQDKIIPKRIRQVGTVGNVLYEQVFLIEGTDKNTHFE